jgi:hypothetical protein
MLRVVLGLTHIVRTKPLSLTSSLSYGCCFFSVSPSSLLSLSSWPPLLSKFSLLSAICSLLSPLFEPNLSALLCHLFSLLPVVSRFFSPFTQLISGFSSPSVFCVLCFRLSFFSLVFSLYSFHTFLFSLLLFCHGVCVCVCVCMCVCFMFSSFCHFSSSSFETSPFQYSTFPSSPHFFQLSLFRTSKPSHLLLLIFLSMSSLPSLSLPSLSLPYHFFHLSLSIFLPSPVTSHFLQSHLSLPIFSVLNF